MDITKIYPEYEQIKPTQPDKKAVCNVVRNSNVPVFYSRWQNFDSGIKTDFYETKKAIEMVSKLDNNTPINPYMAGITLKHSPQETNINKENFVDSPIGKLTYFIAEIFPPLRRLMSVPEKMENNNCEGAGVQAAIAGLNLFGDLRETENAFKEGVNIFKYGLSSIKDYKGQHAMTMLDGTIADAFVDKFSWLKKLNEYDKAIYFTQSGKFFRKILNLKIDMNNINEIERTPIKIPFTNKEITPANPIMRAYNFEGNGIQRLLGRTLMRVSKLGLITTAALEVPSLVRSITNTKGDNIEKSKAFGKQLIKSTAYVGFVTAGIALAGAVLAPTSMILGLVGMSAGSLLGLEMSKAFNKQIDKVIT